MRLLYTILFALLTLNAAAQGNVTRTTTTPKKEQTTKPKPKQQPKAKPRTTPSVTRVQEASGYDVSISSNVPNATMLIDGRNYGNPSGTIYLKTGSHNVVLNYDGYKDFAQTITVNSSNTSFHFTMSREEVYTSTATAPGTFNLKQFLQGPMGINVGSLSSVQLNQIYNTVSRNYIVDDKRSNDFPGLYVWKKDNSALENIKYYGGVLDHFYCSYHSDDHNKLFRLNYSFEYYGFSEQQIFAIMDKITADFNRIGIPIKYNRINETYDKAKGSYRDGNINYEIGLTYYTRYWEIAINRWSF